MGQNINFCCVLIQDKVKLTQLSKLDKPSKLKSRKKKKLKSHSKKSSSSEARKPYNFDRNPKSSALSEKEQPKTNKTVKI